MREHNENAEPDLTDVFHEEIVDSFDTVTLRSVTDIMAALYSRNMSPQALADKLLSMKEILLRKLLINKVKISNGKSFVKGE